MSKLALNLSWSEIRNLLDGSSLIRSERKATADFFSSNLVTSSTEVTNGDVFLAYRGVATDAHRFIPEAISRGAGAFIVESTESLGGIPENIPVLVVNDGRNAWAILSAAVFGNPQNKLKMMAVTGTNGKTSTSWFISKCIETFGNPCLAIGTLGATVSSELFPTAHTTPDPPQLYHLISMASERGAKFCVMEAASQSLLHHKLDLIQFDAAVFTSFSRDHLDLHQTMDDYFAAKWILFKDLLKSSPSSIALINRSIYPWLNRGQMLPPHVVWYGIGDLPGEGYQIEICARTSAGAEICVRTPADETIKARVPLLGDHLIENFCAAAIVCSKILNKNLSDFLGLRLPSVPGRGESFVSNTTTASPIAVVDYAHTPDALEKALISLRQYANGKIHVVFGCGGDRDKGKRPLMGQLAATIADNVVVTSDNPRSEDPEKIIDDVISGIDASKHSKVSRISNRFEAIVSAIFNARVGDVVLVAGKGHEDYQIIGTKKYPFDDRKLVQSALDHWPRKLSEIAK